MRMPKKYVYEVTYKVVSHKRVNSIKAWVMSLIGWLLNKLLKVKIEVEYQGERVRRGKSNASCQD